MRIKDGRESTCRRHHRKKNHHFRKDPQKINQPETSSVWKPAYPTMKEMVWTFSIEDVSDALKHKRGCMLYLNSAKVLEDVDARFSL